MSAYGTIQRPANLVTHTRATAWYVPPKNTNRTSTLPRYITVHHLTLADAKALPGLLDALYGEYVDEIARGATYPHEAATTRDAFETYFFAADVFIGVIGGQAVDVDGRLLIHADAFAPGARIVEGARLREIDLSVEDARAGRTWEDCVAGFYYIKPNYPGRSSHICNGGIVIPHAQRDKGFGALLSRSYIYYAPLLGYHASIFNLVYVNNHASVRLWETLNFVKVGRIPRAGRLRRADGKGEEYVDAWVFYKDFRANEHEVDVVDAEGDKRVVES